MEEPVAKTVADAATHGNAEKLESLLEAGADVNMRSKDGMTSIGIASFWGYLDVVKVLLKHDADVNAQNGGTLWTPLHCAAFQGHGPVIHKLMEATPNLDVKDMRGRTASDFASGLDSIWPLFAAAGCKRTSLPELMKMGIIYRSGAEGEMLSNNVWPSSGYDITSKEMEDCRRDPIMDIAAINGDVLADTADECSSPYSPGLNIYN